MLRKELLIEKNLQDNYHLTFAASLNFKKRFNVTFARCLGFYYLTTFAVLVRSHLHHFQKQHTSVFRRKKPLYDSAHNYDLLDHIIFLISTVYNLLSPHFFLLFVSTLYVFILSLFFIRLQLTVLVSSLFYCLQ